MRENDGSTAQDFDPDTAPDLSRDGWPEKFAKTPVRRGRPPRVPEQDRARIPADG